MQARETRVPSTWRPSSAAVACTAAASAHAVITSTARVNPACATTCPDGCSSSASRARASSTYRASGASTHGFDRGDDHSSDSSALSSSTRINPTLAAGSATTTMTRSPRPAGDADPAALRVELEKRHSAEPRRPRRQPRFAVQRRRERGDPVAVLAEAQTRRRRRARHSPRRSSSPARHAGGVIDSRTVRERRRRSSRALRACEPTSPRARAHRSSNRRSSPSGVARDAATTSRLVVRRRRHGDDRRLRLERRSTASRRCRDGASRERTSSEMPLSCAPISCARSLPSAIEIQAAEHIAVAVEQQRRLSVVDEQIGEQPLRIGRHRRRRRRRRPSSPDDRRTVSSADGHVGAALPRGRAAEISLGVVEPAVLKATRSPGPSSRRRDRVRGAAPSPTRSNARVEIAAVDGDSRHEIVRVDVRGCRSSPRSAILSATSSLSLPAQRFAELAETRGSPDRAPARRSTVESRQSSTSASSTRCR